MKRSKQTSHIESRSNLGKQSAEISEQTRQKMVLTALSRFAVSGFDEVSLRDIADAAGTSHGLIRHHFGTKELIWRAAVDFAVDQHSTTLTTLLTVSPSEPEDPVRTAQHVLYNFLKVSAQQPEIIRMILHEGTEGGERLDYILERFTPIGELMKRLFEQVQSQGYLQQFDNQTFFLHLLLAGAAPLALTALSGWLVKVNPASTTFFEMHVQQFITTLLGTPGSIQAQMEI